MDVSYIKNNGFFIKHLSELKDKEQLKEIIKQIDFNKQSVTIVLYNRKADYNKLINNDFSESDLLNFVVNGLILYLLGDGFLKRESVNNLLDLKKRFLKIRII